MAGREDASELALRFGRNVLRARRLVRLSQEQLGERAELHRAEIGLLERGLRRPRLDTIIKLAGGTEADPADLLDGLSWSPASAGPGGRFYVASEAHHDVRNTGRFDA
jgi:transcriptional regulator with XRE-family HTH domain